MTTDQAIAELIDLGNSPWLPDGWNLVLGLAMRKSQEAGDKQMLQVVTNGEEFRVMRSKSREGGWWCADWQCDSLLVKGRRVLRSYPNLEEAMVSMGKLSAAMFLERWASFDGQVGDGYSIEALAGAASAFGGLQFDLARVANGSVARRRHRTLTEAMASVQRVGEMM